MIGWVSINQIVIKEDQVSCQYVELFFFEECWILWDFQSCNGIFFGSDCVEGDEWFLVGDII